jgi:hypothetical protein
VACACTWQSDGDEQELADTLMRILKVEALKLSSRTPTPTSGLTNASTDAEAEVG